MPFYFFHWTPESVEHLAEHEVTQEDFESIVTQPEAVTQSRSPGRWLAFGTTPDGRFLACVFERDGDDIFPVTAYEVEE